MPVWNVQIEDITETMRFAGMQEHEDVLVPDPVVIDAARVSDRYSALQIIGQFEEDHVDVHVLDRTYTNDELTLTFLGAPNKGAMTRRFHCYATCL